MANPIGYNQTFTDRPEVWRVDGSVSISDGYGAPSISTVPSGIISAVTRISTGKYTISLREAWYGLLSVQIMSEIGSGSPAFAFCQLLSDDVGSAAAPSITFVFINGSGTAVELPSGSAFRYSIALKRSSA